MPEDAKDIVDKIIKDMQQGICQRYCDWWIRKFMGTKTLEEMEDDDTLWERFLIDDAKFKHKIK